MPDHPGPGPGESASHRSDDLGRGSTTVSATPPTRLPFAQGLRKPAATVASASGAPNLTGRRAGRCAAPFAYKQSRFRGGPRRVALLKTDRLSREPDEPVVAPLVAKEWPAQATAGRCSVADPLVSSDYLQIAKAVARSMGRWRVLDAPLGSHRHTDRSPPEGVAWRRRLLDRVRREAVSWQRPACPVQQSPLASCRTLRTPPPGLGL